ncbi:hypothetical protein AX774_g3367 [Zancudomyces culisetae]|uniref:Uncharacterized protein n=1 Tax=Zancudomyces culisetae TaxID=1213189 RepID=A0A1R1PQ89_ZANCU|nr:hypothetical protein AX774_g3367 [Zancudomyces culisetae]|eukprot:OMH83130.1 hypothetical protein AX774_g3367 [Zancudomyces culisetae]
MLGASRIRAKKKLSTTGTLYPASSYVVNTNVVIRHPIETPYTASYTNKIDPVWLGTIPRTIVNTPDTNMDIVITLIAAV